MDKVYFLKFFGIRKNMPYERLYDDENEYLAPQVRVKVCFCKLENRNYSGCRVKCGMWD